MAVRTVSERPSQVASPQPTIPLSVSIRTNNQRGATRKVSILAMRVTGQPLLAPAVGPAPMSFWVASRDGSTSHVAAPFGGRFRCAVPGVGGTLPRKWLEIRLPGRTPTRGRDAGPTHTVGDYDPRQAHPPARRRPHRSTHARNHQCGRAPRAGFGAPSRAAPLPDPRRPRVAGAGAP